MPNTTWPAGCFQQRSGSGLGCVASVVGHDGPVTDAAALLRAYDDQLRTHAETADAVSVTTMGPLLLAMFPAGRAFVTYRDLAGADAGQVDQWIGQALEHYRADDDLVRVEWKIRGHDDVPGLHQALLRHGFRPEETESIMVGEASSLAVDVPVPPGVRLRTVTTQADIRAMSAMQDEVFGDPVSAAYADSLWQRVTRETAAGGGGLELWIAEADDEIVCAGRLEPVPGTDFAGLWGGATRQPWRGRGIYRALTAARARSALAGGKTLLHSDSTEFSRPILERSGLVKVSTTTPYRWNRFGQRPDPTR